MSSIFIKNTTVEESRDFTHYKVYDLGTLKDLSGDGAFRIGGVKAGQIVEIAAVSTVEAVVGGTSPAVSIGTGSTAAALVDSASISAAATILNTGSSFVDGADPNPAARIAVSTDADITMTVTGVGAGATAGKIVVGFKILDLPRFSE